MNFRRPQLRDFGLRPAGLLARGDLRRGLGTSGFRLSFSGSLDFSTKKKFIFKDYLSVLFIWREFMWDFSEEKYMF